MRTSQCGVAMKLSNQAMVNGVGFEEFEKRRLFHQAIVQAQYLRLFVILEHELAGPYFRFFPQQNLGAQVSLQLLKRGTDVGIDVRRTRGYVAACLRAASSQAFNLADGQAAPRSPLRIAHSERRIGDAP